VSLVPNGPAAAERELDDVRPEPADDAVRPGALNGEEAPVVVVDNRVRSGRVPERRDDLLLVGGVGNDEPAFVRL
jgi:hypothetical protein